MNNTWHDWNHPRHYVKIADDNQIPYKKKFLWRFIIFIYSDESDVDKQCFVDQILVVKYEVQSSLTWESTWSVKKKNEKQMENKMLAEGSTVFKVICGRCRSD